MDVAKCASFHSSIVLNHLSLLKVITYSSYCSWLLLCLSSVLRYYWLVLHWYLLNWWGLFKLSVLPWWKWTTFNLSNNIRSFFPNWVVLILSLRLFADDASFNYLCSISKLSVRHPWTDWVTRLIITLVD